MEKDMQIIRNYVLLFFLVFLLSCSTIVTIESDPPNARVILDGKPIGYTPLEISLSNAVWEDYSVRIEKEGYFTKYSYLKKTIKGAPLVIGILFTYIPLLWCYGPAEYQFFTLNPEISLENLSQDSAVLTVNFQEAKVYLDGKKLEQGVYLVNAGEHEVSFEKWGKLITGTVINLESNLAYEIR